LKPQKKIKAPTDISVMLCKGWLWTEEVGGRPLEYAATGFSHYITPFALSDFIPVGASFLFFGKVQFKNNYKHQNFKKL